MTYQRFVRESRQGISEAQYRDIIEPLYLAAGMSDADFIAFVAPSCKRLVKAAKEEALKHQKVVFVGNGEKTPNGCWYVGNFFRLADVDTSLATGRTTYTLKALDIAEQEELARYYDLHYHATLDINAEDIMTVIRVLEEEEGRE